jgi:hypothetical protein
MREILAEEGLAGFDAALGVTGAAIADASITTKDKEAIVVEAAGRQVREHAPVVASLRWLTIDGAAGRQAQISGWMGCSKTAGRFRHVRLIPVSGTNLKSDLGLQALTTGGHVLQTNLTVRDEPPRFVGDVDPPELLGPT